MHKIFYVSPGQYAYIHNYTLKPLVRKEAASDNRDVGAVDPQPSAETPRPDKKR